MIRIGFDTSSLNQLGRDPNIDDLCATLARASAAPLLSALAVVEMLKWADESGRDGLLASVAKLRRVADYRLLPLPHDVVQAEFLAWLTDQPAVVFGGEPIAAGMQDILERAAARESGWREAAETYTRVAQRSFTDRVLAVRASSKQFAEADIPRSAAECVRGILGARDGLALMLNDWFSPSSHGHTALTPDEAARCIENLPTLRSYLVSLSLAAFRHAVQGKSARKPAAGAIDIAQASYVPLTDVFVVDDPGMHEHMEAVVLHARLSTLIVRYKDLPSALTACGVTEPRIRTYQR